MTIATFEANAVQSKRESTRITPKFQKAPGRDLCGTSDPVTLSMESFNLNPT